jgi:Na+/H+ antiporter NhaD/arsenite permease-like protein
MLMIQALGIFAVTYLLMTKPRWPITQLDRPTAGLIGAVLMIAAGVLTPAQAYQAIDWNTIVLLLGMFVLSGSLRLAGFFEWAAEVVLTHVHTPIALLTALVFVSGLLSALLVNDTVCVMLAPLVIALIERSDLPVLPYLFALAMGANIGSVMTVVGNPQNMIIAHAAPLSYVEFARVLAPIGIVNLGLTVAILGGIFRQDLQGRTIMLRPSAIVALDRALLIKASVCLALVVAGFVSGFQLA